MKALQILAALVTVLAASCTPKQNEILVLTERGGQHGPFTDAALQWLADEGAENGYTITEINTAAPITKDFLERFDAIIQLDYPPFGWSEEGQKAFQEYIEEGNLEEIFRMAGELDYVVDAIDTLAPKISLIKYCVEHKIPHVSAMGAGAKLDATKIRIADISKSYNCPLAYILRKKLRKEGISKGFKVVFSEELPDRDAIVPMEERNKKSQVGTISYLPAVFGCVCAQAAIEYLIGEEK